MPALSQIKLRRDTAADWTSANPTLGEGEPGYETDTKRRKTGDGSTAWTSLKYDDPVSITIALSDETTDLTAATDVLTYRAPFAFTITEVRASVNTAPAGSTIIVDINEGGTSILSTKLSIDASETTSTTAASSAVISDAAIADDAELSFDIDQIGSSTAGNGLKVTLIGYRT